MPMFVSHYFITQIEASDQDNSVDSTFQAGKGGGGGGGGYGPVPSSRFLG